MSQDEQIQQRREKLRALWEQGHAFPNHFRRQHDAVDIIAAHDNKDKATLEAEQHEVTVAGRIMMRRLMGKASFIQIQDATGRLQLYVRKQDLPEGVYDAFKGWDIGDIVGGTGVLFRTNTGELSVHLSSIELITKSLRPLPDKWHGLSDQEIRYRQRYLDLIVNQQARRTFQIRSLIVKEIRQFFDKLGFMEVETPMMQVIPGGATARPFITHHNALDMDLYLRVAPELYLKRLVVGGFEKVYEINRNFRNEGLSTRHNPEFTMLEFYHAYADHHELMDLTERLFKQLALAVFGETVFSYQNQSLDFGQPFQRMTLVESLQAFNPHLEQAVLTNRDLLADTLTALGSHVEASWGLGKLQYELFEKTVEDKLMEPTFITAYPTEVSPLARKNSEDPTITDRFEFFVAGRELANGFSELNDPEDQAERFAAQVVQKDAGDAEAMHFDHDYITALEYGMPPTAGEGIGIDRLVMLFTDAASIRDVLLFPHMRPVKSEMLSEEANTDSVKNPT